ncbi:fungal-specific transcription factor [Apodospora peruviana]|uniref:Fungal-specific transcription factor n=1 Tax=Apodospora peruviana TaxID=516989 RepID=A0AAE0I6B3_9PEZI|nr:fungal-specific transcription factor [Apodospora peruviana]
MATPVSSLQQHRPSPNPSPRPNVTESRRRDKPQLSCNACRYRKSRCDRTQPCSNCSSRGQPCIYPANHGPNGLPSKPSPSAGAHERLIQLERLVMSLMPTPTAKPKQNLLAPGPDSGPDIEIAPLVSTQTDTALDGRSDCGSLRVSASELHYVGGDHWAAILDSIADIKDHFEREEQMILTETPDNLLEESRDVPHMSRRPPHALLLYGYHGVFSRADILTALPPKGAVDRYISHYFNRLDLSPSLVHGPTFLQEYEAFWADPSATPIMWLALLFSMMCLAVRASDAAEAGNEVEHKSFQTELYREKLVQCLQLGEYTKGGPYVLETMIQYVYIEFGIRADADQDVWALLGLTLSLAMRMGYHRDPSHFPGIAPLQAEMRRRIWAMVLQGDVLISGQMGMPRLLGDWRCDTAEPRNLNDDDLTDSTVELPPSRPETEYTTSLNVIAKRRMLVALGKISDLTAAIRPRIYTEVMRADAMLNDAAASIPPPLQPKPMTASITDSPQLIMARLFLNHMFHKGQIMLHRRFLHADPPPDVGVEVEDPFAYSRKVCLDASLRSLQIQHVLDEETIPGGQLHVMRWRITSIMNHHFLTATMILCSLLHRGRTMGREEEITKALRRTRAIWIRGSLNSKEAKKAAQTVGIVLARATGDGRRHDSTSGQEDGRGGWQAAGSATRNPRTLRSHSTTDGTNDMTGHEDFDGERLLQLAMGCFEPHSGLAVTPDQLGSRFSFSSVNDAASTTQPDTGAAAVVEEWAMRNGPGMSWL